MTYTCLGNNEYQIRAVVYRDCDNGNPQAYFDDPLSLGIYTQTGNHIRTEYMMFSGIDDTLSSRYPDTCLASNICIHSTVYTKTITLPYNSSGYTLAYQRCCRSADIVNIASPADVGFTLSIDITATAQTTCNSSPKFNNDIPLQLGMNHFFSVDMGATDVDGDSLVYELYVPFEGASTMDPAPNTPSAPPFVPVTYTSPHTLSTPITGSINYDPVTGELSGTPTALGSYVLGLAIKEYNSNGELLSTVYEDFRIYVSTMPCEPRSSNTAVNLILKEENVAVFPNPAEKLLNVQLEPSVELKGILYTATGQQLWSDTFVQNTTIDMEQLPKGIYLLRLMAGEESIVRKIIKN